MDELFNVKNLKQIKYEHGGSRIYLESNHKRILLCDTFSYFDTFSNSTEDNNNQREEIREVIFNAIKEYLGK